MKPITVARPVRGVDLPHDFPATRVIVLDERDCLSEGTPITAQQLFSERVGDSVWLVGHRRHDADYDSPVPPQATDQLTVRAVAPRLPPEPLRGGPVAFLRFARAHNMLRWGYVVLVARWLWLKLRWRGRLQTDGLCFVCSNVKFEIGPNARVVLGRWSWLGDGCKIRAHEGIVKIGAKTVLGQECTISCYQHISIGRESIIADRAMMIDFDHGTVEVERAIREQVFTSETCGSPQRLDRLRRLRSARRHCR